MPIAMNLVLAGALVAAATIAEGASPPGAAMQGGGQIFPYKLRSVTLDNGLKVVVIPFDSPGSLAYLTVVRTGSRDEVEPGHSGFAHFFEHMMFRGTERYPSRKYTETVKGLGGDTNASTTDDYTQYYIAGPSVGLETIMDMESDRFKNLKYSEEDFRTESKAVLGEYNKGASSPFQPMFEKLRELAFTHHTYRHTTIGFVEDIKAMPGYYDYSLQFFRRFYRPENCTVLVVGDASPEKVFALARRYYGDWKPGYQPPAVSPEPDQTEARRAQLDWPNPIRPRIFMGYHTPAFSTSSVDSAALHIIAQLAFGETSPLYRELVVDKQWVDSLDADPDDHRDPYLFLISAQAKSEELLPKVESAIESGLAELQQHAVDPGRLARVKSHERYDFALNLRSPLTVAFVAASFIASSGTIDSINRIFDQIQRVTQDDVQRVARQVLRPENQTVVTIAHRTAPPRQPGGDAGRGTGRVQP